ncbi:hypothetical protein ACVV62_04985 [Streptococcus pluranimalium]
MVKKVTLVAIIFMIIATVVHIIMSIIAFYNGVSLSKNLLNGILIIVFFSIIQTLLDLRKIK